MNPTSLKIFEHALRDLGMTRVRLDQIVTAYHKALPGEAMRPDMRQRLHKALMELIHSGVITVCNPDGDGFTDGEYGLPRAIEFADALAPAPSMAIN